ncbi:M24 family metallopeptidase [Cytobacillus sp. Hm23]
MNQRLKLLSEWLTEQDISMCFVTNPSNVFYYSGFLSDPHERLLALLVFQQEEPILVCPQMETQQVKDAGWTYEIIGYNDTDNPWEFIATAIAKRKINTHSLAVEKDHLNVSRLELLQSLYPNASFIRAEEKLNTLRMLKDSKEIDILRQAAELADYGIEVGVSEIKEGKTEMEILATIEYELKKKGIQQMSFQTMVLTGKKTASPHGNPSTDKIQQGDFILFDLGVVVDGYCSDITRTVALGNISDQQQQIYETVLKAELAALEASKPGVEVGKVDKTARDIITSAGYGEYFTHRIGHGLGIEVHEYPSMSATNNMLLQPGMVYTIEPGIYIPEIGGVRIEDDVVITENGIDTLTKFPKELTII